MAAAHGGCKRVNGRVAPAEVTGPRPLLGSQPGMWGSLVSCRGRADGLRRVWPLLCTCPPHHIPHQEAVHEMFVSTYRRPWGSLAQFHT